MDYSDLIGVPFTYNGRTIEQGFDCYGLVREIHQRKGIELPDYYVDDKNENTPEFKATIAAMMTAGKELWQRCEQEEGAVMLIRLGVYEWHVAMYLGNDKFIHTSEATGGVCIERLSGWWRRVEGYYNYVGK